MFNLKTSVGGCSDLSFVKLAVPCAPKHSAFVHWRQLCGVIWNECLIVNKMKSGYCSSQRISFAPVTGCNQKAWCEESTYGPFETLLHNAFRNDSALQPGWTYWYKSTNICCLSLNRGSSFMFLRCELLLVRTGRLENSGFWLMTVAAWVCPSHTCDRGERFNTCATYHKTASPLASNVLVSSMAKGEGFPVLDQYTYILI